MLLKQILRGILSIWYGLFGFGARLTSIFNGVFQLASLKGPLKTSLISMLHSIKTDKTFN